MTYKPETSPAKAQGKLISVFSPKGGGGATTLAVNLAYEIQKLMQEPSILLDMDQIYNNIALRLNVQPMHCLKELGVHPISEIDDLLLSQVVTSKVHGFNLLPSCKSIHEELEPVSPELLGKTLEHLLQHYSYVLVDLPSGILDPHHQSIIERSDTILLTTLLDIPSVYYTRQYINLLRENDFSHKLQVVINRADLQGAQGFSNLELERNLGIKAYSRLSDDWGLNLRANSLSLPLSEVTPNAALTNEIVRLAADLTDLGLNNLTALEEQDNSKFEFSNLNGSIMNLLRKGLAGHAHF